MSDQGTKPTTDWQPIQTAPTDGTLVWVYAAAYDDLPAFQTVCGYHPDGGWCVDELRQVTHWVPLSCISLPEPTTVAEEHAYERLHDEPTWVRSE